MYLVWCLDTKAKYCYSILHVTFIGSADNVKKFVELIWHLMHCLFIWSLGSNLHAEWPCSCETHWAANPQVNSKSSMINVWGHIYENTMLWINTSESEKLDKDICGVNILHEIYESLKNKYLLFTGCLILQTAINGWIIKMQYLDIS